MARTRLQVVSSNSLPHALISRERWTRPSVTRIDVPAVSSNFQSCPQITQRPEACHYGKQIFF